MEANISLYFKNLKGWSRFILATGAAASRALIIIWTGAQTDLPARQPIRPTARSLSHPRKTKQQQARIQNLGENTRKAPKVTIEDAAVIFVIFIPSITITVS